MLTIFSFVEQGLHNSSICRQDDGGSEDVEMGEQIQANIFLEENYQIC